MNHWSRSFAALCLIATPALAGRQAPPPGRSLPGIDVLADELPRAHFLATSPRDQELLRPGAPLHTLEQYGVPSFLWSSGTNLGAKQARMRGPQTTEQIARAHLTDYAHLYRMLPSDVEGLELREVHDIGRGPVIVRFGQRIQGIEVFRDEIRVAMDRSQTLVSLSGALSGDASALRGPIAFRLAPHEIISLGLDDLHGTRLTQSDLVSQGPRDGGYEEFALDPRSPLAQTVHFSNNARVKKVLYHHADSYEAAYYLELDAGDITSNSTDVYSYVISADTGQVLFRNNLTRSDGFSYRVWADTGGLHTQQNGPQGKVGDPHPTGSPSTFQAPFIQPALITLKHGPITTHDDPWLDPSATDTKGNNAEAYVDLSAPDGLAGGDFRADVTAPGVFDRVYDVTKAPGDSADQRKAAITQLFYDVNYFHDFYYEAGFNEASGNAQDKNYGRGGVEGDSIKAEAQDYSGTDNANMSTPADGGRPRMQMYVWGGNALVHMDITAPASLVTDYNIGDALFGPSTYDLTGNLVQAIYGANLTDGCSPFTNAAAVAGKIAFMDRGNCNFTVKVKNAQNAGATAALIANNVAGGVRMSGDDATITIGSMIALKTDGDAIRTAMGTSTVTVHMKHQGEVDRDGTIDNQISGHEWGHYISNRLISNSNGLSTNMSGGMGEGWADTHSMLMTVAAGDNTAAGNDKWQGVYALAQYVMSGGGNEGYYYGIRRMPYSTDLTKNSLTYIHIQEGTPLPTTAPIAFGDDGVGNSEVHNIGEVWAEMLWECYAAILNDPRNTTFDMARTKWRDYLVAAYKLTPPSPTFLEARDAILAAAVATDATDYASLLAAFTKRGAGTRAVSPDRYSGDNLGVVEDFVVRNPDYQFISVSLDDSVTALCGGDGILTNGETGNLTVTIKNLGATAMTGATATITSTNTHLTFPNGNVISFASIPPLQTGTASIHASMNGATGIQSVPLTITLGAGAVPALAVQSILSANYADVAGQSNKDDVESTHTTWTLATDASLGGTPAPWVRLQETDGNHLWAAPQPGFAADNSLVSPPMQVATTGTLKLTFKHRFAFGVYTDATGTVYYMGGGVVELSTNGTSWSDIGQLSGGYGTNFIYAGFNNPLGGRMTFQGKNPASPNADTVSIDLGDQYKGQTVQIRFRVGASDFPVSAQGWSIDDITVSGLLAPPFHSLLPATGTCSHAPVANAGPNQSVDAKTTVTLDGSASSDADNDTLTYQWTQLSGPAVTLTGATTPHPTFTAPSVVRDTTVTFALVVNDGTFGSAASKVTITIKTTNHVPVANAGPAQTVKVGDTVTLDGSASTDADGDPLTYSWKQTSGTIVGLSNPTSAKPTFVMVQDTVKFDLTVNDGIATSPAATVTITGESGGCGTTSGGGSALAALVPLVFALAMRRRQRLAA